MDKKVKEAFIGVFVVLTFVVIIMGVLVYNTASLDVRVEYLENELEKQNIIYLDREG